MKKDFEATINITQMDREAVDHFTLSEILAIYPDVPDIIINDLEYDHCDHVYYASTGLGRVIFPRHLNETLEDIEALMYDDDTWHFTFRPYSYTFGDRHGYSARFYNVETKKFIYPDTSDIIPDVFKNSKHCTYDGSEGQCDPGDGHSCKICDYYTPNPYQE